MLLSAGVAQAVPSATPDDTAMVDGTSVRAIEQAGNLIWVGGNFDTVKDANGNTIRSVSDLVAFRADPSGALATGVNLPAVTKTGGVATVYDLSLLGNTLYLAGTFDKVDGQARSNVAAIDATTGALLPFNTNAGPANAVLATPSAIFVGTGKLLSFQPNGANTPGFTAPKTFIDGTIRGHNTTPQIRDIEIQGSTLVAACQCDSVTDINNTTAPGRLVKAVVEVNATTGALTGWVPANLPASSGAFGVSVLVHDFPGTATPTVYLAAGGSDFTAAYDFATGAQRFKTDTSGSSQAVAWYQGSLVVGGHFNWSDSPASTSGCGDNANPNTTCYHSPKLVSMDATTGKVILGADNQPWNPGICCAYNGVWTLTTGDDGSTLHVGGEFTKVGGTWSGSGNDWTLNGADTQRYYARLAGPAVSVQPLTVTKSGSGTGTVTSSPAGIACGSTCAANFAQGASVTLSPTPAAGSTFSGWSGACTGTGACALSMTTARDVTAQFSPATQPLTVQAIGSGSVTSTPGSIACPGTCAGTFAQGTTVTLSAVPEPDATFVGWSDDAGACGASPSCPVDMVIARSVTATFTRIEHTLTVVTAGGGIGSVAGNPAGIDCPATNCAAAYTQGTEITLAATAAAGSVFTGWSGACAGSGTCVVVMSSDRSATATFEPTPAVTTLDDADLAVSYNGWRGVIDPSASGGAYRVSDLTNDTLTWKSATATSFAWVTRKGPDLGIANISIDGVDRGTVDLYAATATGATLTYAGLTSKVHTVILTVTGTKNPASSGKGVALDAFTAGAGTAQESDPGVTFGTWKSVANTSASGGSYRWASEATASVTVTFSGSAIDWITTKGGNFGKVGVTIDGVSQGIVDLYAGPQQWQSVLSYAGLTPGVHTFVIQVLNQKNAASGSTKVFVDGFVAHA